MHGTPDWVRMVQVAVTINNEPVVPKTAEEAAFDGYGAITISDATYQTVTTWTVTTDKVGILNKIELACNDYTTTQWKVTVAGVNVLDDDTLPSRTTKDFANMELATGDIVTVKVKSDGSTSITAYADIDGKEVG